jgi:hypothetical protein
MSDTLPPTTQEGDSHLDSNESKISGGQVPSQVIVQQPVHNGGNGGHLSSLSNSHNPPSAIALLQQISVQLNKMNTRLARIERNRWGHCC